MISENWLNGSKRFAVTVLGHQYPSSTQDSSRWFYENKEKHFRTRLTRLFQEYSTVSKENPKSWQTLEVPPDARPHKDGSDRIMRCGERFIRPRSGRASKDKFAPRRVRTDITYAAGTWFMRKDRVETPTGSVWQKCGRVTTRQSPTTPPTGPGWPVAGHLPRRN